MSSLFNKFASATKRKEKALPETETAGEDPVGDKPADDDPAAAAAATSAEDVTDAVTDIEAAAESDKRGMINSLGDFFNTMKEKMPELPKMPTFGKKDMTEEQAAAAGMEILAREGIEGLDDNADEEEKKMYKKILVLIGVTGLSVLALFLLWLLLLRGGKSEGEAIPISALLVQCLFAFFERRTRSKPL